MKKEEKNLYYFDSCGKRRIRLAVCTMLVVSLPMTFSVYGNATENAQAPTQESASACKIGIAWRADLDSEFYTNIEKTLREAGVEPVLLQQVVTEDLPYEADGENVSEECVTENDFLESFYAEIIKENTYENSNAADVLEEVDGVIFTGGEDISPTLLAEAVDWHGIEIEKDYNVTRDVSDYLLLSYCLDHDIPVMGFCRGMQMLAVVSGATVIQDIPMYFDELDLPYAYEHRNEKETPESYRDYVPHNVMVTDKDSLLYKMSETEEIENVPSWHHQAVESVEGTNLKVTGITTVSGIDMIEAIERTDLPFAVGLQFHPEASIVKHLENVENADDYMNMEDAFKYFEYFIEECEK